MFSVLASCRAELRSAARPSRAFTLSLRANSSSTVDSSPTEVTERKDQDEVVETSEEGEGFKQQLSDAIRPEDTGSEPWKPSLRYESNTFIYPYQFHRKHQTRKPTRANRYRDTALIKYEDPFRQLGVDPRKQCDNTQLLTYWNTTMGKLPSHRITGLTMKSHRMYSKALKRSKQMGFTPIFSNK